ncbi:two pore calcium channel protein 2 isoform X2 [Cyclopterus lumpus]|uniref:two pore calcium channel protein 2 isoform X2 n=1 Tax=Cyclopterus lumpus TaxID=8103 RepID=UPI001487086D|nr:two pore calcium channel protein 2 isoform X2 [Cyclopterus lumpus]
METHGLLTGSVDGASEEYGSLSSNERGGARRKSSGRGLLAVAGQPCGVEMDSGVEGEVVSLSDAEELYIQQAVVLIEDAVQYRSINHRMDARSLSLYRWYYSRLCQWGLGLAIAVDLLLAFVERPSSMSVSSDPRIRLPPWEPPCGFTQSIEIVCLVVFALDLAVKGYLIGWEEFRKSKWLIGYTVVITFSVMDWVLSVSMACDEDPKKNGQWKKYFRDLPTALTSLLVLLTTANNPDVMIPAYSLKRANAIFFMIFSMIGTYCLMNLMTAIIYNQFRGCLLMSVQTSIIRRRLGIRAAFQVLSCQGARQAAEECVAVDLVMKVMSRVQMKSYYKEAITKEVQKYADGGYMDREEFRKMFDDLNEDRIKEHPPLPQYNSPVLQRIQVVFTHYFLMILGNIMALANVICICTFLVLNSEKSTTERDYYIIEIVNLCFILYYLFEMCVKIFAFGWKGYLSYRSNIFDCFLNILLLILQITILFTYRLPYSHWDPSSEGVLSLWDLLRLINMLIVFRFLRIIPDIKLLALVASTMLDLVKNLRAFAGILIVAYYVFAVLGIWLFEGVIKLPEMSVISNTSMENMASNLTMQCGTYEELGYWPNNFDDFAAAIILLYDIMVVNNWQAFLTVYNRYGTPWSKVYFVTWWLTSSVMWVNLFVAVILENFTYKWDRSHSCTVTDVEKIRFETSVQFMFREQIQEPTEEELLCQLNQHPHLHLHW